MKRVLRFAMPAVMLALFFGGAAIDANAQGILGEILKRMDEHNKSLTSLRASVTMVKHNAQLNDSETTQGKAIYRPQKGRDALVRIDWVKPDESLAVVNKQYVIYRPRLQQAYTGTTNKAQGSAKANSALAFMNMSRAQLKANYDVAYLSEATVSGGVQTWHLRLTPKTASSYKSAEIWVDKNGFPVQTKVTEMNDDTTTVLLSDIEKNISLDASLFNISLPKGTKVVKG